MVGGLTEGEAMIGGSTGPLARRRAHIRSLAGKILGRVIIYGLLLAGSALFASPFVWMVTTSLKRVDQMFASPSWWPNPIVWENYIEPWAWLPTTRFYLNTVRLAALRVLGTVLSCTIVAYSFARLRFPGRDFMFLVLLSTMMLPGQVTLVPLYIWFSKMGWVNTFKPLVVPSFFGGAFSIFLLRQFFMTIPRELDDAAKIDGCGYLRTLVSILLPLATPAIGVVAIFTFTGAWNDFMGPLIYLSDLEKYTIAIGLRMFQSRTSTYLIPQLMAMATVALIPQLVIFFFTQRQMVQGVVLTGIKG